MRVSNQTYDDSEVKLMILFSKPMQSDIYVKQLDIYMHAYTTTQRMTMLLRRYSDTSSSCASAILLLLACSEACSCTTNTLLETTASWLLYSFYLSGLPEMHPYGTRSTIETEAPKVTGPRSSLQQHLEA